MRIRDATSEDARLLATDFWYPLAKQMEDYSDLNELREDAAEHAVDGFERLLDSDDHRVFLLEVDEDAETDDHGPVAYLLVEFGDHPSRERGDYLQLVDLYAKDDHRGQGHGSALVEHAEALAASEGCDFLKVSAEWANEPAREFYRDHDYEPKLVTYAKPLD